MGCGGAVWRGEEGGGQPGASRRGRQRRASMSGKDGDGNPCSLEKDEVSIFLGVCACACARVRACVRVWWCVVVVVVCGCVDWGGGGQQPADGWGEGPVAAVKNGPRTFPWCPTTTTCAQNALAETEALSPSPTIGLDRLHPYHSIAHTPESHPPAPRKVLCHAVRANGLHPAERLAEVCVDGGARDGIQALQLNVGTPAVGRVGRHTFSALDVQSNGIATASLHPIPVPLTMLKTSLQTPSPAPSHVIYKRGLMRHPLTGSTFARSSRQLPEGQCQPKSRAGGKGEREGGGGGGGGG